MYFSSATAERFQLNLVRWRFISNIYHMPEISRPIIGHCYYKTYTEIKVTRTIHILSYVKILRTTVADPDPYVFGPPGSVSQRYLRILLSTAKIVRKTWIPTVLCLLYDFLSLI
jgi:hypothetical protein